MSGIADNFQLHTLLMDAFPRGRLRGRRIPARVAANARGEGPQALDDTVEGAWNLCTYCDRCATAAASSVRFATPSLV